MDTLDKYEYKVRADEIKALIADGEYEEAVKIADSIDWRRVKSVMMLCTISDLYKINRRYEDSRDILLLAYEKQKGRLIVYSLCELSIKLGEYVQAIEYYKEFVQLAPKDSGKYILQYKLYEAQDVSLEERIEVLEELKSYDYREKWAYELAYLYHRVGLESKCVEECDEMILWFGEGRYVLKAYELKQLHTPLTPEQQESYEQLKNHNGMQEPDLVADQAVVRESVQYETEEEADDEYSRPLSQLTDDTKPIHKDELDIQVKPVDVGQYNTINLQETVAEGIREILENKTEEMPVSEVNDLMMTQMYEPVESAAQEPVFMQEQATGVMEEVSEPAQTEESTEASKAVIQGTEAFRPQEPVFAQEQTADVVEEVSEPATPVLRQDTDEMKLITDEQLQGEEAVQEVAVVPADTQAEAVAQEKSEEVFFGNTSEVNIQEVVTELTQKNADRTAFVPVSEEQSAMSNTGVIRTFHKKSGYDDILSQEYDGQISLVVPEAEKVEKQITGQLSIEDVMAEWERMKKENEEKRLQEIRSRVRKQTDNLFADFDESTKSGLLEELEKAMVTAAIKEEKLRADKEKPKVVKVSDIEKQRLEKEAAQAVEEQEPSAEEAKAVTVVRPEETKPLEVENREPVMEEAPEAEYEYEAEEAGQTETAEAIEEALWEEADDAEQENEAQGDSEDITEEDEVPVLAEAEEETEVQTLETVEAETDASETEVQEETGAQKEEKQADETAAGGVRDLTDSERELFAPFIHHKRTRRQVANVLDHVSLASYTGNVVVTGEEGTETTAFAKLLIREVQAADSNFSGKVAKISGSVLNKKDIAETLNKLANGALIVEGAASLKKPSVETLIREMNQEDKGLILILEDTKGKMDAFLTKNKGLSEVFNLRVDLEALDDQTLVKYARKYALDQEYAIDELGILALHTRIADMQTGDHEVTLAEIEELIDEAIYYADRKTPKHFFDVLFGNRYDEEDMIILREKDFMHY